METRYFVDAASVLVLLLTEAVVVAAHFAEIPRPIIACQVDGYSAMAMCEQRIVCEPCWEQDIVGRIYVGVLGC